MENFQDIIKSIEIMRLQPGDVLVVKTEPGFEISSEAPKEMKDWIQEHLHYDFDVPILLAHGVSLQVLRPTDPTDTY